jgi:hypothetical protein
MFKNTLYKIIVWAFYHIGDIACNLPWEWSFNLYQKSMLISVTYDKKIGFQFWQKPSINTTNNT